MKEEIFYSSHGCCSKWSEIKNIEVFERENYDLADAEYWEDKYNMNDDTRVIWVTPSLNIAVSYMVDADEYDKIIGMSQEKLLEYIAENDIDYPSGFTKKDGIIILESDDGDQGFLMILK